MTVDASTSDLAPAIFVIFGITGDLSQRKLLPALYHLVREGLLPEHVEIIGVTRREVTADELLAKAAATITEQDGTCDAQVFDKMRALLRMVTLDLTDAAEYERLRDLLDETETKHGVCMNRLFYLSIPPQVYAPIVRLLGEHNLHHGCRHGRAEARLLVEKPFGFNLASAKQLIQETGAYFTEPQIFRIDHYVAKETVQNILTFRFDNPLFETIWNDRHVSHIQISAIEQIDIQGRATFYEEMGALRDFVQSHLLQLLAILTMERPSEMVSDDIHAAKLRLLNAIQPVTGEAIWERTVRAQYEGYRDEVHNPRSVRETFAALLLSIDNEQWRNVPVLIRTGKALDKKETKLTVVFRDKAGQTANSLQFRIQPDEGISLYLRAKKPGFDDVTQPVAMDFSYQQTFKDHGHPDAYERVLVDAVRGDHTLFSTSEEVLASWRVLEQVVQAWESSDRELEVYKKGSSGPESADELAQMVGCTWL